MYFEDLGDRHLHPSFDLLIEVDELPSESLGEDPTDGRFSGGHESDEDDPAHHSGSPSVSDLLEISLVVTSGLPHRVASEFFEEGVCEDDCDHCLSDDPGGGECDDIAPLPDRVALISGPEVDTLEWPHQAREWFHCDTQDEWLSCRDPPFETSGLVPDPTVPAGQGPFLISLDLIVDCRSGPSCCIEPSPDLDALHRLYREECLSESAIELPIPGDMAPEPYW